MEQSKVYHLQTHKVSSYGEDKMPIMEHILVKLSGFLLLTKYCNFLKQDGIIATNPPKITKVLINNQDAGIEEIQTAQKIVDDLLKVPEKQRNYEHAYEDQKKRNNSLEKRLAALETSDEQVSAEKAMKLNEDENLHTEKKVLQAKAKELNIVFRSNIGNEKLLGKIIEIEPEYQM